MIQRRQSIYLLVIAIISIVLVLSDIPFYQETGAVSAEHATTTITVDYNSTDTSSEQIGTNHSLIYFLLAAGALALISIFLFKNRKLQLRLIFGVIVLLVVIVVGMYGYSFGQDYTTVGTQVKVLPGGLVPLSQFVFALLAYRGVQRDEKLVRSLDRIR